MRDSVLVDGICLSRQIVEKAIKMLNEPEAFKPGQRVVFRSREHRVIDTSVASGSLGYYLNKWWEDLLSVKLLPPDESGGGIVYLVRDDDGVVVRANPAHCCTYEFWIQKLGNSRLNWGTMGTAK